MTLATLCFPGVVFGSNTRECSRGPHDGPSQPTPIQGHRHARQLPGLQPTLQLSRRDTDEHGEALRGVVDGEEDKGRRGHRVFRLVMNFYRRVTLSISRLISVALMIARLLIRLQEVIRFGVQFHPVSVNLLVGDDRTDFLSETWTKWTPHRDMEDWWWSWWWSHTGRRFLLYCRYWLLLLLMGVEFVCLCVAWKSSLSPPDDITVMTSYKFELSYHQMCVKVTQKKLIVTWRWNVSGFNQSIVNVFDLLIILMDQKLIKNCLNFSYIEDISRYKSRN